MNKTALILSAVLTTAILVLVGGILFSVRAANRAEVAPTVDPQTEAAILEREAAYQDLINQANSQIVELQAQNEQLRSTVVSTTAAPTMAVPASTQITPEQAAEIAGQSIGETQIYSVESIDWLDMPAYKVVFSSGSLVIVGMDGQVLAIQAATAYADGSDDSAFAGNNYGRGSDSQGGGGGEHEPEDGGGGGDD